MSGKSSHLTTVRTVGSIVTQKGLKNFLSLNAAECCDAVEFRADAFPDQADELLAAMRSCPVPRLLTVRDPREGGLNELSLTRREALLWKLLPEADLVDIEIANLPALAGPAAEALAREVTLIGSFHDFAGTPDAGTLSALAATAEKSGVEIVKIAAVLRNAQDLQPLAGMLESRAASGKGPAVSVMGMGPLGRVSRLLFAKMGSVLNYGYLDEATVPGQWPAARLRALIQEM